MPPVPKRRSRRPSAAATQAQRAADRCALGRLRDIVVLPRTLKRYSVAAAQFFLFLKAYGLAFPRTLERLDQLAAAFLEELWQRGSPRGAAGDCLSALSHFVPRVRGHLPTSHRHFAAWGRAELPARAPPIPRLFLYAAAQFCFSQGWKDTAVLLLLGFDTLARPAELFAAQRQHFTLDPEAGKGVWTLPLSKSGQRLGTQEMISLRDPWIVAMLVLFTASLRPSSTLSCTSAPQHRVRFAAALTALNVNLGFRWYSVRRGGATAAYERTQNMSVVQELGRWTSARTARIYITEGMAVLQLLQISATVAARLSALAGQLRPSEIVSSCRR